MLNNSGLITRGMGPDHKLLRRGMGKNFELQGGGFDKRSRAYSIGVRAPVSKEDFLSIGVYSPLEINREERARIRAGISKELEDNFNILSEIDRSKLMKILDQI